MRMERSRTGNYGEDRESGEWEKRINEHNHRREIAMRRLWVTARNYGVDNEGLHVLCQSELGEEHISTLTLKQLDHLTKRIKGKVAVSGAASSKQIWYIKKLAEELGWDENPRRLLGFVQKYTGKSGNDMLTHKEASNVIEGLKRIKED